MYLEYIFRNADYWDWAWRGHCSPGALAFTLIPASLAPAEIERGKKLGASDCNAPFLHVTGPVAFWMGRSLLCRGHEWTLLSTSCEAGTFLSSMSAFLAMEYALRCNIVLSPYCDQSARDVLAHLNIRVLILLLWGYMGEALQANIPPYEKCPLDFFKSIHFGPLSSLPPLPVDSMLHPGHRTSFNSSHHWGENSSHLWHPRLTVTHDTSLAARPAGSPCGAFKSWHVFHHEIIRPFQTAPRLGKYCTSEPI